MARIMVVDDSFSARNNLRIILKRVGHEVVAEASTGHEAIKLYRKYIPDLVTMDITMPELDGIEATAEIINHYPDARIIMVSAVAQKSRILQAMDRGAKHYILKPFHEEMVVDVIGKVLKETGYAPPVVKVAEETCENIQDANNP